MGALSVEEQHMQRHRTAKQKDSLEEWTWLRMAALERSLRSVAKAESEEGGLTLMAVKSCPSQAARDDWGSSLAGGLTGMCLMLGFGERFLFKEYVLL